MNQTERRTTTTCEFNDIAFVEVCESDHLTKLLDHKSCRSDFTSLILFEHVTDKSLLYAYISYLFRFDLMSVLPHRY